MDYDCTEQGLQCWVEEIFFGSYGNLDLDAFFAAMHENALVLSSAEDGPIAGLTAIKDYYRQRLDGSFASSFSDRVVRCFGATGIVCQNFTHHAVKDPGAALVSGRSLFCFHHDGQTWSFVAAHNAPHP